MGSKGGGGSEWHSGPGGKLYQPPPPPPAPVDPMAMMAPMMGMMQSMMGQFAQQQMQMMQALQLPPMPENLMPEPFDFEAEREAIAARLEENPADAEALRRGRASTRVVSPLADDDDDLDILRINAGGQPI